MKKKSTLASLLLAALLSGSPAAVQAQNYDFSKVDWKQMVEVFCKALEQGKQYPSDQDIMNLGISKADLAFIKSHVRRRPLIGADSRLLQDTYKGRKLWMNTPMGSGSGGDAGYPTGTWHNDVFSLWNYTALWGAWNHGIGQVPGSWTDAAHKNGCDMMGGTVFFDTGSTAGFTEWTSRGNAKSNDPNVSYNGFKYVKPLVNMLMYFGMDGININWELNVYSLRYYKDFHQSMYKYAHEVGFDNFHLGIYTTATMLTTDVAADRYADAGGQIADLMLNYHGESYSGNSVETAYRANPTLGASGVWQGFWIETMDHYWSELNADEKAKEMNICLWGEHKDSRFWSYNSGAGTMGQQENYQGFLERAFSGGNRSPLDRPAVNDAGNKMEWSGNTPPLSTFAGFATWIPERSTVGGSFPFATNFNLGNGDRYNYRGKKAAGAWYNMSAQDIVPTYRWLVLEAGQKVDGNARTSKSLNVSFSHADAYTGGSCLELKGDASRPTDVILYKTSLTPNDAKGYALIATKGAGERPEGGVQSNLSLILEVNGAWKEYAVPDNKGRNWEEHRIPLNLTTADKVTHIGLRVKGGSEGYDMYVGGIQLNDGKTVEPKAVTSLEIAKTAETASSMDLKLNWDVNITPNQYGIAYNDDAAIDHFEILFKDGEQGTVKEIGRTSQWAAFVPAVSVEGVAHPFVGVVAVSKDLKTLSAPVWQAVEKGKNLKENPFGTYGQSSLNVNAEGYATAIRLRGVERFKTTGATQDIDYHLTYDQYKAENDGGNAEFLNYHHASGQVLKVTQGQEIQFTLKGFNGEELNGGGSKDDCRYCFVGGWMDFDGSGTFNYGKGAVEQPFWKPLYDTRTDQENFLFDETSKDGTEEYGERVFRAGSLRKGNPCLVKGEGLKGTITIPADAHVGKSRLRIVYSDAWFAGQFSPTANTNKGYTLDIDVEILGSEAGQRGPKDFHDQGETEDWTVVTEIDEVDRNSTAAVQVVAGNLVFKDVNAAVVYTTDGVQVRSLTRPTVVSGSELGHGVYLVRLNGGKTVKVIL
ncbi:MAG: glycosyl hydrolase family 85 [Prevotella sp.]|nr:glycosyl hydrolase family 85 [Prevotella sp.]